MWDAVPQFAVQRNQQLADFLGSSLTFVPGVTQFCVLNLVMNRHQGNG